MNPHYTDQEKVEAFLNRELTDNESLLLDNAIANASSLIESYTGRKWQSIDGDDPEVEERFFDGDHSRELMVDEFDELEQVTVLDSMGGVYATYTEDSDYIFTPNNTAPKSSIVLRSGYFPEGIGNIIVKAKFSSGELPEDVIWAATALTANLLTKQSTSGGNFKSESIEGYSYTLKDGASYDSDNQSILASLDRYKRILL